MKPCPRYVDVKTALKKENFTDTFVAGKYRFSPYRACGHACSYCDGRAEKYYVEGDFEKDIIVRKNLPRVLERELQRVREKGFISIGSGVSDAYQPVEKTEGIMREVASLLPAFRHPVVLLTKSVLVARDREYWQQVNRNARFLLFVSLTFLNDELGKIFEPGASPATERLELIQSFKKMGCAVGVLAMPVLPYITDTDKNLSALFQRLKCMGVDCVIPGWLTLRPGIQKETFFRVLHTRFSHLTEKYTELYKKNRRSGNPLFVYRKELEKRFFHYIQLYKLNPLVPHYIYRDHLHNYDALHVLLQHMVILYKQRGIDTTPLQTGYGNYMKWLAREKQKYNRRRSLKYSDLELYLEEMARNGELAEILSNKKLSTFVNKVILEKLCFDYRTLQLEA
jgi:DNA repair photolyase